MRYIRTRDTALGPFERPVVATTERMKAMCQGNYYSKHERKRRAKQPKIGRNDCGMRRHVSVRYRAGRASVTGVVCYDRRAQRAHFRAAFVRSSRNVYRFFGRLAK